MTTRPGHQPATATVAAHGHPDLRALIDAVEHEVTAAVREAWTNWRSSPYFAHGRLSRALGTLRWRLGQVAEQRPELLSALADHLGVPDSVSAVTADVERRAATILRQAFESLLDDPAFEGSARDPACPGFHGRLHPWA